MSIDTIYTHLGPAITLSFTHGHPLFTPRLSERHDKAFAIIETEGGGRDHIRSHSPVIIYKWLLGKKKRAWPVNYDIKAVVFPSRWKTCANR